MTFPAAERFSAIPRSAAQTRILVAALDLFADHGVSGTSLQMMADALGRPLITCLEKEATSRGAALLAMERIGAIGHIRDLPAEMGPVYQAVAGHRAIYEDQLSRQRRLYTKLFEEN